MRFVLSFILAAIALGQNNQRTRPCLAELSPKAESQQLVRLLREKGPDALFEELLRPGRIRWAAIRAALRAPDGLMYFSESVQHSQLLEMSGVIVSGDGAELQLAMSGGNEPDLTLKLDGDPSTSFEPGATVLFVGIAMEFSPAPFRLTLQANRDQIRILPVAAR